MKKTLLPLILLIACLLSISQAAARGTAQTEPTPPPPELKGVHQEGELAEVEASIQQAILNGGGELLVAQLFTTQVDHLAISADQQWASAWLSPVDEMTGDLLPVEPGLAVVIKEGEGWRTLLPGDPEWESAVRQAPVDLLPEETKADWLLTDSQMAQAQVAGPLGGYLLPWADGKTVYLSQSVGHDKYTPSGNAHYSFDFYVPKAMFDLYASKGGVVKYAKWDCLNGNEKCGNYLVLEDPTTSPVTYQLYLHLAQNSIPAALRVPGTLVVQGQYIGVADDTGVSTGHHLHFMVHTNPSSYWGQSVDIVFADVAINGGRPRMARYDPPYCRSGDVCQAFSDSYVSGNGVRSGMAPPEGGILKPSHGTVIAAGQAFLEGWARGWDKGLGSAQFVAFYGDAWHEVAPPAKVESFTAEWDMCTSNVPDGPVALAVKYRDLAGNILPELSTPRHFTKDYACPPPAPMCSPTSSEVAVFAEPNYGGACVTLPAGSHASSALGELGVDNAASILVGGNVAATLFSGDYQSGRGETLIANDSNLADNLVGADTVSSILLQIRSSKPKPNTPAQVWPSSGAAFASGTSLSLAWRNTGGGYQYRVKLDGVDQSWQFKPFLPLGSLSSGTHRWQVQAVSPDSVSSDWSAERTFTIDTAPSASNLSPLAAPFDDTMETSAYPWKNSSNWDKTTSDNHTPNGATSWQYEVAGAASGYDNGSASAGDLTSPPITLSTGAAQYMRFWYLYETEGPGPDWDQRWVQISVDGGPFLNLLQFYDDPPNTWLESPAISLAAYAGRTVQIRFHIETLDNALNGYKGWRIDDFSVSSTPPPACTAADEANNLPGGAGALSYGAVVSGEICPSGDLDLYKFTGSAGDRIGIAIEAQTAGSVLDSTIFLLDSDGVSVLAENDDQVHAERRDSFLAYTLPRSGVYFIKVRAWDHPSTGTPQASYTLRLYSEGEDPIAAFLYPREGLPLAPRQITLDVAAMDTGSGISRVEFLYHSPDWKNSPWELLGTDWDGRDGWTLPYDLSKMPRFSGLAFYARVYDWAGNWAGTGSWNLESAAFIYLPQIRK